MLGGTVLVNLVLQRIVSKTSLAWNSLRRPTYVASLVMDLCAPRRQFARAFRSAFARLVAHGRNSSRRRSPASRLSRTATPGRASGCPSGRCCAVRRVPECERDRRPRITVGRRKHGWHQGGREVAHLIGGATADVCSRPPCPGRAFSESTHVLVRSLLLAIEHAVISGAASRATSVLYEGTQ